MNKKILIASVMAGLFLLISSGVDPVKGKIVTTKDSEIINEDKDEDYGDIVMTDSNFVKLVTKQVMEVSKKVSDKLVPKKPNYDILLDEKVQDYLWKQTYLHKWSYEHLLAIAYTESKFKLNAFNDKNKNGTTDGGFFQVNSSNVLKASKALGYTVDVNNPYHSIDVAIWLLDDLRSRYSYLEMSAETEFYFVTMSYNQNEIEVFNYISINGCNGSDYVEKVLKYKQMLEEFGTIKELG